MKLKNILNKYINTIYMNNKQNIPLQMLSDEIYGPLEENETHSDDDDTEPEDAPWCDPIYKIRAIFHRVFDEDGIDQFEGVLLSLDEYLKKRCPNRFPNYYISTCGFEDCDSKIIIEHGVEKNEFGIEIINCSEIQIPSWFLDQIYYIDNKEIFLKYMPSMVRQGLGLRYETDKQRLKEKEEEAQKSENYYINEIKSFPFLVASAYHNPGPMRKELKKYFIPIINTINTLLNK